PPADTSPPVNNAATSTATAATPATAGADTTNAVAPSAAPTTTPSAPAEGSSSMWNFDSDKTNAAPTGFSFGRTGQGKEGRWTIVAVADAPSKPNVLAQLDADSTDYRFPVAVVDASSFKDVKLSVSCKPISGKIDQGCGLVWRYKDANNYYLTGANALENNVRLYHVKDGHRVQFATWNGKVATKTWHSLAVEARGDHFVVTFDGQQVLDAKDSTFTEAGKIGGG